MKNKFHSLFSLFALMCGIHSALAQTTNLSIAAVGNQSVLYWSTGATNYILLSSTNLTSPNWLSATDAVSVIAVTVTNTPPSRFFRLIYVPSGMAFIPAGSFTMGNSLDGDPTGLPLHLVNVSAFYMDKYTVTKAMWSGVYQWATNHGYSFDYAGSGKATNHPVQQIDWYDAVKWCNARSEMEGRLPAYYANAAQTVIYRTGALGLTNGCVNWNSGYRLPTEAEWEKAARGGASGQRFPLGNTISESQANYYSSSSSYAYDLSNTGYNTNFISGGTPYTSPVGFFAPNGYGLYDMGGNVWQWCWDWYASYGSASQTDPHGPDSGAGRLLRGGSWSNFAVSLRVADRYNGYQPTTSTYDIGFRTVLPIGL